MVDNIFDIALVFFFVGLLYAASNGFLLTSLFLIVGLGAMFINNDDDY